MEGRYVSQTFGDPDDLKLISSMPPFARTAAPESLFEQVLEKNFRGCGDPLTLTCSSSLSKAAEDGKLIASSLRCGDQVIAPD